MTYIYIKIKDYYLQDNRKYIIKEEMKRSSKDQFICLVKYKRRWFSSKNKTIFKVECWFRKTNVVLLKIEQFFLFSTIFRVDKTIIWNSSLFSPNWNSNLSLKTSSELLISKSKCRFNSSPSESNNSSLKSPKNLCSQNSSSFVELFTFHCMQRVRNPKLLYLNFGDRKKEGRILNLVPHSQKNWNPT